MPRAPSRQARAQRNAAIRADRARGWSLRKIAKWHGVSLSLAHRLAHDVHIQLPGRWHRSRLPKEAPLPLLPVVHLLRSR